ncbi:MAG: hypothetical protein ACERK9_12525 [Deltaproteobacteria bacterium]
MFGRLRRTATSDKNIQLFSIRLGRPEKMVVRVANALVLPMLAIAIQFLDGRWVGMPLIKITDYLRDTFFVAFTFIRILVTGCVCTYPGLQ